MTRVRVVLADAPTDVLVHLVGRPTTERWSLVDLATACAPDGTAGAAATVAGAVLLLLDAGFVARGWQDGRTVFHATTAGRLAVAEATAA